MIKDWDPLAPTGIDAEQARAFRSTPRIAALHKKQEQLKVDMRFAADKEERTELSQAHSEVGKEIKRVKQALRREANAKVRNEYFEEAPVLELKKQIQQLKQGSSATKDSEQIDTGAEEWEPPVPEYVFQERARIADAFWGPNAGTLAGEAALDQRIQAVKDLAALCHLREQRVLGKRINRYASDSGPTMESLSSIETVKQPDPPKIPLHCPRTQCIVCFNEMGPCLTHEFSSIDGVRRHVQDQHLAKMAPLWRCEHPACREMDPLRSLKAFLYHAAKVHNYDIRMRPDRRGRKGPLATMTPNNKITNTLKDAV